MPDTDEAHPRAPSPMPAARPLRIGLLVDDVHVDPYTRDLVRWSLEQTDVVISHLIICRRDDARRSRLAHFAKDPRRWYELASRAAFRVLVRLEAFALGSSARDREHLQRFDVSALVAERLEVQPVVSTSGVVTRLTDVDLARLRALDIDVLIRCGGGILKGGILKAARLGVLSPHHGDNRVNRGGPPGFWECYLGWASTGFVIQRLTEELDGGDVLLRGAVTTQLTFLANQVHLFTKAAPHLQRLLLEIARSGSLPRAEERWPYSGPLYRAPRLHVSVAYLSKLIGRKGRKIVRRLRGRRIRWGITQIGAGWRDASMWRGARLALPAGRFWADPFLVEWQGRTVCFVEDYAYRTRRGVITAIELDGALSTEVGVALEEPFHMSFPFVFRYAGGLYMCPESVERRQIRVYRCVDFPSRWELASVLMDDVAAADTLIFERAGRWWLLTNLEPAGTDDHVELYAFSADHPLSTQWRPHPMNPLKCDPDGGRNGGLVAEGDRLFRLGQRQGFDQYGYGLAVFEIETLDESRFAERRVSDLVPGFRGDLLGVHHLSTTGRITVIDHMTHERVGVARRAREVPARRAVVPAGIPREQG